MSMDISAHLGARFVKIEIILCKVYLFLGAFIDKKSIN